MLAGRKKTKPIGERGRREAETGGILGRHRLLVPGLLLTAFLAFFTTACDELALAPDDGVVEGVDFSVLFAPPTDAELAAVSESWEARAPSAEGHEIERSSQVFLASTEATLHVVSHLVDGYRHYGMVLVPSGFSAGDLPVLVYAHGDDDGVSLDELLVLASLAEGDGQSFVYAAPSFRSEPVELPSETLWSEGPPSPWDRDVDDALAFLDVVLATVEESDPSRIGVWGVSRGGGVALLMGIRDPRIRAVVNFSGPTDFFDTYVQDLVEDALRGTPRSLPGIDVLTETLVEPLKAGEIEIEEVRLELARRSAVFFVHRLPPVQTHHGGGDQLVDVSQARSLERALEDLGSAAPEHEVIIYPGIGHDPVGVILAFPRAISFLKRLLHGSAPDIE